MAEMDGLIIPFILMNLLRHHHPVAPQIMFRTHDRERIADKNSEPRLSVLPVTKLSTQNFFNIISTKMLSKNKLRQTMAIEPSSTLNKTSYLKDLYARHL
jgi:hypothetical protein